MRIPTVLFLLLLVALAPAQQTPRALTHDDYDAWQSIRGETISRDGRWVAYSVTPQEGDAVLHVRSTDGDAHHVQTRGTRPTFTADGRFVLFTVAPAQADEIAWELRELAKKGKKGKKKDDDEKKPEKPLDGLGILDLADGTLRVVERVKQFRVPDEGPSFVAYLLEKEPKKDDDAKKKGAAAAEKTGGEGAAEPQSKPEPEKQPGEPVIGEPVIGEPVIGEPVIGEPVIGEPVTAVPSESAEKKDEPESERKDLKDGLDLVIVDLIAGTETRMKGVVDFGITAKKGYIYWSTSSKKDDPEIPRGLHARRLGGNETSTLVAGGADFKSFRTDRDVARLVFLSNRRDREAEKPTYDLYEWDFAAPAATRLVAHDETADFPSGYVVSPDTAARFCRDGSALLFGVQERPEEDLPDVLERERVTVDIWHWQDPLLQPMQEKRAGQTRQRALDCVWHFAESRMIVASESLDDSVSFLTPDGSRLLVRTSERYGPEVSWDTRYEDVSVVNSIDGSRRQVLTHRGGGISSSPDGRYLAWFEHGVWHATDLVEETTRPLTADLEVSFAREEWDTPAPARAYGIAGWTEGEREILLYDRFDVWRIRTDGSRATCLTDGFGRANRIELRWLRFDADEKERFFPAEGPVLLTALDEKTMASGFYRDLADGLAKPSEIVMRDASFGRPRKADDADRLLYTIQTFRDSPDLWTSALDFVEPRRLSALNPQQEGIRWGRTELVQWRSADGKPLEGIVIKPDGFDPSKRYPLMVYFYERLSQTLHRYRAPGPGTSPNPSYYVSNGYVWFMPDIVYREGYPGESCLSCVVPGVQKLIEQGFIDEDAIGAAGHSWGGYQTAYLVTRTDIFKAVESGAPVSNMTSAYGGIRWGTGMSRAFQYEKTQSRIGGTLWDRPLRYLENSPLFYADKVQTPVLMLHNDRDGAVPWYQGIEYFCALRRLGKEAYLFNYNGADHGLRKRANQMDWTVRMQQYFDHHLRDRPAPSWMRDGVPFVDREAEKRAFRPPRHRVREEQPVAAPEASGSAAPKTAGSTSEEL